MSEIEGKNASEISTQLSPLDEFKSWIKENPKYPQHMNDALLKRFLKVNDNNVKKAQELLTYNLTLRQKAPQLFTGRDILADEIQKAADILQFCPLPKLTKEGYKITIGGIKDPDPNKFDYLSCIKMVLMLFDTRFSEYDNDGELAEGEIVINDMKDMGWRHLWKSVAHFATANFYMKFLQEATPIRIVQAHIVNPSGVAYRMFTMFRPFMKKELLDVMHFHPNGLESLYEHIPRELLPKELGGDESLCMEDIRVDYLRKMEAKREFLMNEENWKIGAKEIVDESEDEFEDADDDDSNDEKKSKK